MIDKLRITIISRANMHFLTDIIFFHDSQMDMVRSERDGLVESTDAGLYHWVDPGLVRKISFCNSTTRVEDARIKVAPSSNWLVFQVDSNKRICICFDNCSIPFMNAYFPD